MSGNDEALLGWADVPVIARRFAKISATNWQCPAPLNRDRLNWPSVNVLIKKRNIFRSEISRQVVSNNANLLGKIDRRS